MAPTYHMEKGRQLWTAMPNLLGFDQRRGPGIAILVLAPPAL